jgi:hypothetical protein
VACVRGPGRLRVFSFQQGRDRIGTDRVEPKSRAARVKVVRAIGLCRLDACRLSGSHLCGGGGPRTLDLRPDASGLIALLPARPVLVLLHEPSVTDADGLISRHSTCVMFVNGWACKDK